MENKNLKQRAIEALKSNPTSEQIAESMTRLIVRKHQRKIRLLVALTRRFDRKGK